MFAFHGQVQGGFGIRGGPMPVRQQPVRREVFENLGSDSDCMNETEAVMNKMGTLTTVLFTDGLQTENKQQMEEKKEAIEEMERTIDEMKDSLTVLHVFFRKVQKMSEDALDKKAVSRSSAAKKLIKIEEEKGRSQTMSMEGQTAHKKRIDDLQKEIVTGKSQVEVLDNDEDAQLEEWTGLRAEEIIFDSTVDNWAQHDSVFATKVMNIPNIVFLVEDTMGNKFGGYISQQIRNYMQHIFDPNAFVFSLKSNGRLNGMMKFPIANPHEALTMYPDNIDWLISIGSDGGRGGTDDITIMKSDCQHHHPRNGCVQQTYNYNGHQNALCGSQHFDLKRLTVLRMC